jgi:hypothetical protein
MKKIVVVLFSNFITILVLFFLIQMYLFEPAPLLKIPTIDQVQQITIEDENDHVLFNIKDPVKINLILEFVQEHNKNWQLPLGNTMPAYSYSATFTQNQKIKLIIWWGTGSLGARDKNDSTSNRLKPLSSKTEKQLFDLIGISYSDN